VAWLVFPTASGLISVFLLTLGMQGSFQVLLDRNRRDIWDEKMNPVKANYLLTIAIVAIFMGSVTGFTLITRLVPAEALRSLFSIQFQLTPLQAVDLSRIHFGSFGELFTHNLTIFGLSILISWVYREGGAMLILSWNASVWALSYAYLMRSTVVLGKGTWFSSTLAIVGGITPHLILEAAAYIIGAMGGIFLAKAIEKYHWNDDPFRRVLRASLMLIVIGVAILAVGCLIESAWPRLWVHWVL